MPNKKEKKVHLTDRDFDVARWVAEQGAVRLDTIRQLLDLWKCSVEGRGLRRLSQRWEDAGLLHRARLLANAPSILWPTVESMRLANLPLHRGEKAPVPSLSLIQHTVAVARVRLEYEKNGASWICERRLRASTQGHLCDGVAVYQEGRIQVEVDRTRKEKSRSELIMASNARASQGWVDYWTTPELKPFLQDQRDRLDETLKARVRIFLIPEEVR